MKLVLLTAAGGADLLYIILPQLKPRNGNHRNIKRGFHGMNTHTASPYILQKPKCTHIDPDDISQYFSAGGKDLKYKARPPHVLVIFPLIIAWAYSSRNISFRGPLTARWKDRYWYSSKCRIYGRMRGNTWSDRNTVLGGMVKYFEWNAQG